jgi:hypothetical protein
MPRTCSGFGHDILGRKVAESEANRKMKSPSSACRYLGLVRLRSIVVVNRSWPELISHEVRQQVDESLGHSGMMVSRPNQVNRTLLMEAFDFEDGQLPATLLLSDAH